jgi:gas vesicle protein
MYDERAQSTSSGFITGLLTGMVCGGVLALLFAPKAGRELRGDLNESMGSARDVMGRRYREVAERASAAAERASAAMGQVQQKAQGMAADARDFVQSKMNQGREAVDGSTQH